MTKRQELLKKILREELENCGEEVDEKFLREIHEQLSRPQRPNRNKIGTTVVLKRRGPNPTEPARWANLTGIERATIKGYIVNGADIVGWKPYGDDPRQQRLVNNHYGNAVWFGNALQIDRPRALAVHEKRLEQVLAKVDHRGATGQAANPGPDPTNQPAAAELTEVVDNNGFDTEKFGYTPGDEGEGGVPDPISDGKGGVITPPDEDTVNLEKTAEELREALRNIFRSI